MPGMSLTTIGMALGMFGGAGAATRTYAQILVEDYGADEVWPLVDIESGTTIHAYVNGNRDGTLSGWDLQNGAGPLNNTSAPLSGVGDYGNILTSNGSDGLNDIFSGGIGSIFMFVQPAAGTWTDGSDHYYFYLRTDTGNSILARQYEFGNNQYRYGASIGGTNSFPTVVSPASPTDWMTVGMSWKDGDNGDEIALFENGTAIDTTSNVGFGSWSGSLTVATIGARTTSPQGPLEGHLAYVAIKTGSVWTATDFQGMTEEAAETTWFAAP